MPGSGPPRLSYAAARFYARAGRARRLLVGLLLVGLFLATTSCGGGQGTPGQDVGTVALLNQSDLGMAPLVITEFYFQPVGVGGLASNLLTQDLQPGGIVIVGLFPEGLYNAVAVLELGGTISFLDVPVTAGQPTNIVIPTP